MHNTEFAALSNRLFASGVSPRYVRRIVLEMEDHLEDLRAEAMAGGMDEEEATRISLARLGDQQEIAERMLSNVELKAWIYRYPRIARLYLPLVYLLVLPVAPVFSGITDPGKVVRWGAALMMSAGVTATMLLCMQLAIVLT